MEQQTKFKFKTFLYYLLVEPWTERFTLPNFRTIAWILIIVSLVIKSTFLLIISIMIGLISYLTYEFKSGKYIHWYRQRKYKGYKNALKEVREKRKHEKEKKEDR